MKVSEKMNEAFVQIDRVHKDREALVSRWEPSHKQHLNTCRELAALQDLSMVISPGLVTTRMRFAKSGNYKRNIAMSRLKCLRIAFREQRNANRKPGAKMADQGIRPELRIAEWAFDYYDGKIDIDEAQRRIDEGHFQGKLPGSKSQYYNLFIFEVSMLMIM